jgi:hypothetical protein
MTSVNYQLTLDHVKQKSLVSTLTQIPKHASHSHTVAAKEMETISSPQKPARTDVGAHAKDKCSLIMRRGNVGHVWGHVRALPQYLVASALVGVAAQREQ